LLSLDKAVDTVFAAVSSGKRGETYVPQVAANTTDLAKAVMGEKICRSFYIFCKD
jgi:UDP-glucose 4-epimerase